MATFALFEKGSLFFTLEEFQKLFLQFQQENDVAFCRKASKKLTNNHPGSDTLVYKFILFECKQGKKRPSASRGIRPNQRTWKCDCGAFLRLSTVETGGSWALKVTGSNMAHSNHPDGRKSDCLYQRKELLEGTKTISVLTTTPPAAMDVQFTVDCTEVPSENGMDATTVVSSEPEHTSDVVQINDTKDLDPLTQRLQKGEVYQSYAEFMDLLQNYHQEHYCYYVVQTAEKIKFNPALSEQLVYQAVTFGCKQGRKKARSDSRGIRPNQKSFKVDCKAFIRLGLKQQGTGEYVLEIKKSNLQHNGHPVTPENAFKYPENRRVVLHDKIKDMMKSPAVNTKELLDFIQQDQDIKLTAKDIYNAKRKVCLEDGIPVPTRPSIKSPTQKGKSLAGVDRETALQPLISKSWTILSDRDALHKEFLFSSFNEAFRFITGIGLEANRMGHYPEWHNLNTRVAIILQTPSTAGLTSKDIKLAHYIESLAM